MHAIYFQCIFMYITFLHAGTGKTMLAKEWKNIKSKYSAFVLKTLQLECYYLMFYVDLKNLKIQII